MSKVLTVLISLALFSTTLFAADEITQRSLLKRSVYFVDTKGNVEKAEYWSIPFGTFSFIVNRKYPGEGVLKVEAEGNLAFISSGYIEGTGFGERGKVQVKAEFVVVDADTVKLVLLEEIDYVSMGGSQIKLKTGEIKDLKLMIEEEDNIKTAKGLGIRIYKMNPEWDELKMSKDIDRIIAFSFTADGAKRAYKAAVAAANQ